MHFCLSVTWADSHSLLTYTTQIMRSLKFREIDRIMSAFADTPNVFASGPNAILAAKLQIVLDQISYLDDNLIIIILRRRTNRLH